MMIAKKAPNPIDKHVGSRVRMRRMMLGMSQEKLGDAELDIALDEGIENGVGNLIRDLVRMAFGNRLAGEQIV